MTADRQRFAPIDLHIFCGTFATIENCERSKLVPTIVAIAIGSLCFGLSQAVTASLFRAYPRGGCIGLIVAMLIGAGGYVAVTKWQHNADVAALRSMTDEQLSFRVLNDMLALNRKDRGGLEAAKLPSYQEALRRGGLYRSDQGEVLPPGTSMQEASTAPIPTASPSGAAVTSPLPTSQSNNDADAENQLLEKEAERQRVAERDARAKADADRARDDATIRALNRESDDRVRRLRQQRGAEDSETTAIIRNGL